MHRLQFHYTLSRAEPHEAPLPAAGLRNTLMDLLQAVERSGSISGGARQLGLSYRHVWGRLRHWEQELGQELVLWEKGQAARLSEFGSKLMWAERQAQARLAPQLDALRAELERSFSVAFDAHAHVVTLHASHDEALSQLRDHALRQDDGALHLDIRFSGSVDAIRSLNEGRCVMAGFHTLLQAGPGSLTQRTYQPLLRPGLHKIIGFARRTQGLMVAPGNPLALRDLADVARRGARFAKRALGTGTRVALDELLTAAGLTPAHIPGYGQDEPSHDAVAQRIAAGQADTGLGIAAAAARAGLDFVPLADERYHLVCLKSALEEPGIRALRDLLQGQTWQQRLGALAGYSPWHCGEVLSLREVLPWWTFARRKRARAPRPLNPGRRSESR